MNLSFRLLLLLLFSSIIMVAQEPDWDLIVKETLEKRNTDTLELIYDAWSKEGIPVDKAKIEHQRDFIRKTYLLYPEIAETFYKNNMGFSTNHSSADEIYFFLPSRITIEFLDLNFDVYEVLASRLKIPLDSTSSYHPYVLKQIAGQYIIDSFLLGAKANPPVVIFEFRPFLSSDSFRIVYQDLESEFLKAYMEAVSDPEIERSLLEQGKKRDEIHKRWGSFQTTTDVIEERNARIRFFTQMRLNIADRVERIAFTPDLKQAIVEMRTGEYDDCCRKIYSLYTKIGSEWKFTMVLWEEVKTCMDGPECVIR